jgi:tetratricopeptide (TPR) repeat protein
MTLGYQDYGRMLLWQKKYDQAIKYFQQGLAVTPEANDNRIQGYKQLDDINRQRNFFYALLCQSYEAKRDYTEALGYCLKALAILPNRVSDLELTAQLQQKLKQPVLALAITARLAALEPQNPRWSYWALDLAKQAKDQRAINFWTAKAKAFDEYQLDKKEKPVFLKPPAENF